jgi:hypothetical protein
VITHIVLFRPNDGLADADRDALLAAITRARREIPSIRRFSVGRRTRYGHHYEQLMTEDYPWAAIVEFDTAAALAAYLEHPAHAELGRLLWEVSAAVLVYDYADATPGFEVGCP